jgi:hypothetical protein
MGMAPANMEDYAKEAEVTTVETPTTEAPTTEQEVK